MAIINGLSGARALARAIGDFTAKPREIEDQIRCGSSAPVLMPVLLGCSDSTQVQIVFAD